MIDKQQFRDTFDKVHASEHLLTEVLEMTNETKQKPRLVGRGMRTLLIAAVLVFALSITAVAAAGAVGVKGDPGGALESFFGNGGTYAEGEAVVTYDEWGKLKTSLPAWSRAPLDMEAAERLIAPYLYTLEDNTVTKEGFTYTVHFILYDSATKTYLMYWSVENPAGLGDYGIGINGEFFTKESSVMYAVAGGRDYIDTLNSTDTKLYISSYAVDHGEDLWCEFGVRHSIHEKADTKLLMIPRSDRGGMPYVTAGGPVTVSPIAIRVEGVTDGTDLWDLTLLYDDGSSYTVFDDEAFVYNATYGFLGQEGYLTYTFNRLVDVERVSGVIVNGEVLPMG